MKRPSDGLIAGAVLLVAASAVARGETRVTVDRHDIASATPAFTFANTPVPARNDAAATAAFAIVGGEPDPNSGGIAVLNDGQVPAGEDEPARNFFFSAGTDGGRITVDLGRVIEIARVGTYSWHPADRGPQVYTLFASEGSGAGFNSAPKRSTDPATCGWRRIAQVDTRPSADDAGGQYGVSIVDSDGALGRFRWLLFDVSRTEAVDPFGNTFFSEIDVVDRAAPPPEAVEVPAVQLARRVFEAGDGRYRIILDTTDAPDLSAWAFGELAPVLQEWYPKIVALLPGEGYHPPRSVLIRFHASLPVLALTDGARIHCSAPWFRENLQGEAKGAVVHELVHVVQRYGHVRQTPAGDVRNPAWLVEGIPDYIRWFRYEPQSRGAEIAPGMAGLARHDAGYRMTGNFLNWVAGKHGDAVVTKVNAALREGRYSDDLWRKWTGRALPELGAAWKADLAK